MKQLGLLLAACLLLSGCGRTPPAADDGGTLIVATTYPVYCLVTAVVGDTAGVEVVRLISEPVSCLHDYSLSSADMRLLERADVVVVSGAGLEEFLDEPLKQCKAKVLDSSIGIALLDDDPHYWLNPEHAVMMVKTIAAGLGADPAAAVAELEALLPAARAALAGITSRELVTFHDGFSYLADCLELDILAAIEEEAGAEASARELAEIAALVQTHHLPAVFCEVNGSQSAAETIARETGVKVFSLTTMLAPLDGELDGIAGYRALFEYNVDTLREALS